MEATAQALRFLCNEDIIEVPFFQRSYVWNEDKTLQYKYQLEHIMPQKWEENWSNVDYVDENGNVLPKDESSKKARYVKIYSLGNMTLLNGRLNASISNNNFNNKMEGVGKKKGIKKYSTLSVTKDDLVEKIYGENKTWNEQTIAEREADLGDEIVSLWCENIKK